MDRKHQIVSLFALLLFAAAVLIAVIVYVPSHRDGLPEDAAETHGGAEQDRPSSVADSTTGSAGSDHGRIVEDGTDLDGPGEPGIPIYLILDDGGFDLENIRAFSGFQGTFTVAVLPGRPATRSTARMVEALGHTVMLHQPMEPVSDKDPGAGAIRVEDSDEQIISTLEQNIAELPEAVGVNNHMGSKATTDLRVMRTVSRVLKDRHLFFVDSRTTSATVAERAADEVNLPFERRHVFLDNVRTQEAISQQIDETLERAREQGYAVAIGHVTSPQLAKVLDERYKEIVAQGFRFASIRELFDGDSGVK